MDDGYVDYLLSEDMDTEEHGMNGMGEVASTLRASKAVLDGCELKSQSGHEFMSLNG